MSERRYRGAVTPPQPIAEGSATKRPYLRGDARRAQLLEAATRILDESGLAAVTVIAVAEEAGVSRRLVYDHFPDLTSLLNALLVLQAERYTTLLDAIHEAEAENFHDLVRQSFGVLVAMPRRDLALLRLVLIDTERAELAAARDHLRERFVRRWRRFVPDTVDDAVANAGIWSSVGSAMLMAELVGAGELTVEQATELQYVIATSMPTQLATVDAALRER